MPKFSLLGPLLLGLLLTACTSDNYQDLDQFMAEKKARPVGVIKPIPVFKAYKAFNYSAAGMRGPFDQPVDVGEITRMQLNSNVKPNSLSMVGTLEQGGQFWALLQDGDGGVHRIQTGNYVGRNHGKIVEAGENYLSVIEIVPNGVDGWVERPKTIKIQTLED